MDVVLVSITGISLVLAVAMGVIVFRLVREERERSEARVALLQADAAQAAPLPRRAAAHVRAAGHAPTAQQLDQDTLFAPREARSPWVARLAVAATVAAIVATAGYALLPAGNAGAAGAGRAPAPGAALELLTLRHTQQDQSLTVTGTVRNPRSGQAHTQIIATALLFGRDGTFLNSGRTTLDASRLKPGDQSEFVITVPVTGGVARYRVGFRDGRGNVVAHVDLRPNATAAHHVRESRRAGWDR